MKKRALLIAAALAIVGSTTACSVGAGSGEKADTQVASKADAALKEV